MNTTTNTSNPRSARGANRLGYPRARTLFFAAATVAALGVAPSLRADRVNHDVPAGYFHIDEPIPAFDDNANVSAEELISVNGLSMVTNVINRGDYRVQIGASFDDDTANGVLITAVAQNGNANWTNASGVFTNNFQTPVSTPYSGGYWEAGIFKCPPISSTSANQGEDNVDVTVAYFPFSSFLAGYALNGANGQELTNFVGSPGLVLGTHFMDYLTNSAVEDPVANGVFYLDLRSFGIDSRRDGILLVNHAKNEANYALSRINNDDDEMDGTWTIYTHDNRANGRSYEQDPVAFVFVPKSNTDIVSGMFNGDGSITMYSGNAPEFTVDWRTDIGNGNYELKIPGRSPKDGVLVISAAGGDPFNGDNIVTFQPNATMDGWIIQSRDLPGCGLQSPPENEPVCSFVFIPAERPGLTATPDKNILTYENGGFGQFTVTLNGYPKPTADVTVNVNSSDLGEGTVFPSSITFTPADWNVPMFVGVTGVNDAIVDGTQPYNIVISSTTSTDPNYNNLSGTTVGMLNIDDEAGISVDASQIVTTEAGGTATFSIWLNTPPSGDVTLNLSSSDTTEATVSPASMTFTTGDWFVPQVVTVTGVDDFVQDGTSGYFVVTATATSSDPAYNNFDALDVQGQNLDDDLAGVIVPAGVVTVSEPNGTGGFAIELGSEPIADVTINFASSDTTEGTVTPSVTFTPMNWNIPKNVTVTAVDDLVNDGPVAFTITTTVTSTDPLYAAINPDDVSAVTLDNEISLELPSGDFVYGIGDGAMGIDGYATVNDADTADYNSGGLTVTITSGGISTDRLAVRNDGTGLGQIGVAGSTVSYSGAAFATISGGTGTSPLAITFNNASATPEAVQALVRAVTYHNVDAGAAISTRALSFVLADGDGGVSTVVKNIIVGVLRVYSFQQDADGGFGAYTNAADCEINHQFPSTPFPAGSSANGIWIDFDLLSLFPEDQPQGLLRFTNIFGNGPGQIPVGSKIVYANVIMNVADSGHGARFNRMLGDWDADFSTWELFGSGIQLDDIEAVSGTNAFLGDQNHSTTTGGGLMKIGVNSDVQAWTDGADNYGWVLSTWEQGGNGTAFTPCESTNVALRPRLVIGWVPASATAATFAQGVDGYTGASDTQIRLTAPTTSYAANTTLAPDGAVAATPIPNPQQVLMRFDDIVGNGAGQIPANSEIHAAILELTSITSDSQGNGATIHALLQPWTDATATWDSWVNGISIDGIEAAITPTATLPTEGQGANVQSTRHNIDLTADVRAWVNGSLANNGWVLMPWPGGNNGWGFNSAEADPLDTRPQLRVYYTPGSAPEQITIQTPVYNGGTVQLTFNGTVGQTYSVQRVGALGGTWATIGTATVQPGGTATFTDNSPLAGAAFYRVVFP